jgi:hypothetical protein
MISKVAAGVRLAVSHTRRRFETVLDRDTPVAGIIPIAVPSLEIRKSKRLLRDLRLRPRLSNAPTTKER